MTIVAAAFDPDTGRGALAADRAMTAGDLQTLNGRKVLALEPGVLLGTAGTGVLFRWTRREALGVWGRSSDLDLDTWQRLDLLAEAWAAWGRAHNATLGDGCIQGELLVVTPDGIFEVDCDGGVHRLDRYMAVGTGSGLAMGAMHALTAGGITDPLMLVRAAVLAACAHSASCAGGPDVLTLEAP